MRNNNNKLDKIWRIILRYVTPSLIIFSLAFCISYMAIAEFMAIDKSNASSTIHASVTAGDYYLNLTSLGEVNVNLNTTTAGSSNSADDIITVNTNTSGYKLYLSTSSTDSGSSKMYLDGDINSEYTINPVDSESGATTLTTNTWGFSIDNGSTYTAIPIKGNEKLFATKSDLIDGADTTNNHTITYGVKVDSGLPAGNYSATVSYSAVSEASNVTNLANIYPNEIDRTNTGTFTLTVTTPMMTNMEAGEWTVSITPSEGGDSISCADPTAVKNDTGISITCSAPKNLAAGTYTVTATSVKYGNTYTASNALTYNEMLSDLFTITEMQEMTSDICSNTKTPSATATSYDTDGSHRDSDAYIPQWILSDTRDNKKYVVQKMPDSKCWMVQNLAINPGVLPASKTNISSDYTLPNTISFSDNTEADVVVGSHTDGSLTSTGNWYSFVAATAGTGNSVTDNGDNASGDICPKNWRLPNGGSSGEFQALYNYYNDKNKFDAVWYPVYAGYYEDELFGLSGSVGYWWSRTSSSDANAYLLDDSARGNINLAGDGSRYYGFSVRCVAQ